jgi:hypothetical protein
VRARTYLPVKLLNNSMISGQAFTTSTSHHAEKES